MHDVDEIVENEMLYRRAVFRNKKLWGYFIDTNGYVYSNRQGYLKKLSVQQGDDWNPYPKINLDVGEDKRKTVMVHRLVCETFHSKPLPEVLTEEEWTVIPENIKNKLVEHISHADRYQVNHIDHDINNFHPTNLEWVTTKENQKKYQEHKKKVAIELNV